MPPRKLTVPAMPRVCRVVIVGAGGNIGSHLVPHLARLPMITEVFLVDADIYEEKNLATQDITASDVGQEKVEVQARRMLRIRPELRVTTAARPVETLPLGRLRGNILLGCVDSRRARQVLNEIAWALDMPWIDAGVLADHMLARVSRYAPSAESACLECAWSQQDYALVEQSYPCDRFPVGAASTNAPSGLGALAAALQALECERALNLADDGHGLAHEILIDAAYHHLYSTKLNRNSACLFDHARLNIRPLSLDAACATVSDLLDAHRAASDAPQVPRSFRVYGQAFAGELVCREGCAQPPYAPYVLSRALDEQRKCASCGGPLNAPGFSVQPSLSTGGNRMALSRTVLRDLGIQERDVLCIEDAAGAPSYYEILAPARDCDASTGACGIAAQGLTEGVAL